ncbi:MAG TPA: AAA family ATPase [Actinomycetota bacterium]|nr:AAA family ATPase [Actinomycetota bacterium]
MTPPAGQPLPTGTVTFFFSDVEGSTKLLQALGGGYDEVIGAHNRILREVFARLGGSEISTEGDSFFVVFRNARYAVEAAVEAQRALAAYPFPDGVKMRIRIGIHTGEGRLVGDSYRGLDVHRAARIAAAANGGQILVSETTRILSEGSAGNTIRFVDLGEHRLKDLERPEHLYQVSAEGLEASSPAPRTVDGHANNLPLPVSAFVGRQRELRDLKKALADNRMVTMTGTGGTGKSRLAIQAGNELLDSFEDGVFIVFLASVGDPELVPSAVAQTLGLQKQGLTSVMETVVRYLSGKQMLLILDNFEHLLPAASFVAELLAETAHLKILVTSRAALRISAEQEFPVPPMSLPSRYGDDLNELEQSEAVTLFLQRARLVRPDFELTPSNAAAIREICLRLDGLPLALELAAARMRTLLPHQVASRLNRSLDLLTSGARDLPDRQRTLRNTVAWSFELLDQDQRRLFCQLGVFVGGFSLDAVEAVCCDDALDLLEGLAEHSLVKAVTGLQGTRYLLLEPVREYAVERLEEGGEADATRERHARYFLEMAERAGKQMLGPEQVEWLDRLEMENDNLRAALAWAIGAGRHELAARMSWSLWMFWWLHGYHQEGRRSMESLLRLDLPAASRSMALVVAGNMALVAGDHPAAQAWFREGIELAREIGDYPRLAIALQSLGLSALNGMQLDEAVSAFAEALPLFTAAGNQMMVSGIHTHLGTAALLRGDLETADASTRQGLEIARRSADPVSTYFALYNLGQVALARRNFEEAAPLLREGLSLARQIGNQARVTYFLESLAIVFGAQGDVDRAARLLGASAALKDAGEIATFNYLTPSRDLYERAVEAVRAKMGREGYDEAFNDGRQLTLQQAVAYALEGELPGSDAQLLPLLELPARPSGERPDARTEPAGPPLTGGYLRDSGRHPAFVGRTRELSFLEARLDQAAEGRGSVLFVSGEPGIGKSRLVEELARRAEAGGWRVLSGGNSEGGGRPAFWPWCPVVRGAATAVEPAHRLPALGAGAAEVIQAIPGMADIVGPAPFPPAMDPESARMRLFEAVGNLLASASQDRPLLVVLEDLQWADVASLQLLGSMWRTVGRARVVVVGTYRPEEVATNHPLSEALAELSRRQVTSRLELAGMDKRDVERLVAAVTGRDPPEELVDQVVQRTDGNPLFVTELARMPGPPEGEAGRPGVPSAVKDLLVRRLAGLSKPAATVLALAAVAGRRFDLNVVADAAGLDTEVALQLIEDGVSAGVVHEISEDVGSFRFTHDLVRETVLETQTGARRAVLHGKIAAALERIHGENVRLFEVAHHFYEAAPALGAVRALPYALKAAEVAVGCLAYEEAEQQLGNALDLVARLPSGLEQDRKELEILLRISSLLTMRGGFGAPQNGDVLARAHQLCTKLNETHEMVAVLYGLAIFELVSAHYDGAIALAGQLEQLARQSNDRTVTMISNLATGIVELHRGNLSTARRHLEQALANQPATRDQWLGAWFPLHPGAFASTFLAWLTWLEGDHQGARKLAEQALAVAVEAGDPFTICHCMAFDIWMAIWNEEVDHVAGAAEDLQRVAAEKGFPLYLADGVVFSGWALSRRGQNETAAQVISEGTTGLEATGASMLQSIFLSFLAEAEWKAGRSLDGLNVVDRALKFVETTGERFYEAELHRLRGELLLAVDANDRAGAEREFRLALEIAAGQGARSLEDRAARSLEELQARSG